MPHGAWININTKQIHMNFGQITLNWPLEEFELWIGQLQDIIVMYETLTVKSAIICDACGTVNEIIDIDDEPEFN